MWMFPVALVCGNSFIFKPSERAPSASLILAEWLKEAGLPDGVFNVVQGDKEAVDALLHHPDVQAVSFVGSTPIARYIYGTAAVQGKRAQALGGAKKHMIVMPDADVDQAVDALMGAAYGSAGELHGDLRCGPCRREDREYSGREAGSTGARPQGRPGYRSGSGNGAPHYETASRQGEGYIEVEVEQGATLLVDGRGLTLQCYENGYFIGGSLFDHVIPDMRIYNEEIFGPVLAVARAPDFATAARWVNEHEFGNGTAIFTRDGDAAREFAHSISGRDGWRQYSDPGSDGFPFIRRLESLAVRGPPHCMARRRAVLYPAQDHNLALAHRYSRRARFCHATMR
jgi:malonate-semialdehyde dehydrogenase (acetylating)/methylmalonate-semialdehyde dehydrogenase